jgi:hypothetical protein
VAKNLATQGIEVRRATEPVTVGTRQIPAGAYLVSHAQPSGRLIRNLLEAHIPQPDDFIRRQEERRARRQPDQIYDITAWSPPLLYDVEVVSSRSAITTKADLLPMAYDAPPAARTFTQRKVGYLMPWDRGCAALAARGAAPGHPPAQRGGAFTLNGRTIPSARPSSGNAGNPSDWHACLTALATKHGAEVVPSTPRMWSRGFRSAATTAVPEGPGAACCLGHPHAVFRSGGRADTLERRFDSLSPPSESRSLICARICPSSTSSSCPRATTTAPSMTPCSARLKDWLRNGGTLVTLAEASRWATGENVGLLDTKTLLKNGNLDVPGEKPAPGMPRSAATGGATGEATPTGESSPTGQPPATGSREASGSGTKPPAAPTSKSSVICFISGPGFICVICDPVPCAIRRHIRVRL